MSVIHGFSNNPEAKRGGKLVNIQIGPHSQIKMYEDEARARGYLPPLGVEKKRPVARNKKKTPGATQDK